MSDIIFQFWGKARPLDPSSAVAFHPLPYHCLDVAAVGHVLLQRHNGLGFLYEHLGLERATADRLIVLLLALHDLGKFSRPFQAKVPALYPTVLGELPSRADPGHSNSGLVIWTELLDTPARECFEEPQALDPLVKAVLGHHGRPVRMPAGQGLRVLLGSTGQQAALAFWQAMTKLFLTDGWPIAIDERAAIGASFPLAGFAVLCDWLGSNQEWFPYAAVDRSPDSYWAERALPAAERAVAESGILPAAARPVAGYSALTGGDFSPRPMQSWAEKVEIPDGPTLFLIEDDTGSGKTEAAVMLAHRLIAAERASGLYIALPTMATANAMYERMGKVYRRLFADPAVPSLALAHSARDLHPGFRAAHLPTDGREPDYGRNGSESGLGDSPDDVPASAACAEWIADDRRRTFLADVGVGTVDQALLAVLPTKFQSLRLFGLCGRVLVLDEIHAYDAYMQQQIETLLRFHAAFGGSAVLLSATLPDAMRRQFIGAFTGERAGAASESPPEASPYPLASVAAPGRHATKAVPASRARSVSVGLLDSPATALARVEQAAQAGAAVLYLRNSVDDAIEATHGLAERGLSPLLFHARFALCDRLAREETVIRSFGRDSTEYGRAGKVLVATQVVEQSLDLDFDLVVSDLAPVDLLIQRAGRLWRHDHRRRPLECPELLVVSPEPTESADRNWLTRLLPRSAPVYPNHALLWTTARALADLGCIESPSGLRPLIEAVYGPEAEDRAPPALDRFWIDAQGQDGADRATALQNTLALGDGYVWGSGAWESDVRTPTRLGDPTTVLRLARLEDDRVVPWADRGPGGAGTLWRAWRLSECRVRSTLVDGEAEWPADLAAAVAAAKASWGRIDSEKVLAVLNPVEDGSHVADLRSGKRVKTLNYNINYGVTLT